MDIDPQYPTVSDEARRGLLEAKAQLESEAPEGAAPDPVEQEMAEAENKAEAAGAGETGGGAKKDK